MQNRLSRKILACAAFVIFAGAANAECVFYPDPDYAGGEWTLQNNDRVHWYVPDEQAAQYPLTPAASAWTGRVYVDNESGANDRMSSVRVVGMCKAVIYEDPNGNGASLEVTSDTPNLAGTGLDDVTSMADCVCTG